MRGHRHMILLVRRGRDRIDAGGISAFCLFSRDQRRRGHLRNHEAGVEARLRRQERRQAGQRRIDKHGDAPLGNRADLADRHRDHVGGEGDRLGVEIAARQGLVVVRENQRIVGDAIRLGIRGSRGLAQQIEAARPSPAAGSAGSRDPARARRPTDARRGSRCPPSGRAARRPTSIWPLCRRSAWMRGSKGVSEPLAASVDSAPVTSADWNSDFRFEQRRPAHTAVENCVPLSSARPSFGPSVSGSRPSARPSVAGIRPCGSRTLRRRQSSPPSCARAVQGRPRRRPNPAPGMTGITPVHEHRLQQVERVAPECPMRLGQARELQRHHQPRDPVRASARPRRRHGRARYCAGASRDHRLRSARCASFPKPVLMPYTGLPRATMRATACALFSTSAWQAGSSFGVAPR